MKRNTNYVERPDFRTKLHELGFDYELTNGQMYWRENVGYSFTKREISEIEKATNELTQMCFNSIDYVIKNNLFHLFKIPESFIPLIKRSWERDDFTLYGRFDLCFKDGKIKMFEFNADTPTSLIEGSLAQYYWMKDRGESDQFNSIHESMISQWEHFKKRYGEQVVYFSTIEENQEDFRTTEYIMDCASQAGLSVKFIYMEDIGSDGEYFYDLDENKIEYLFKLYPWEWMVNENFSDVLLKENCLIIEPIWKMLLSNKALLPILWELYPNHHYLLKASFNKEDIGRTYVKKPILSREGANVEIVERDVVIEKKDGDYGEEGHIYQELFTLPDVDGFRPVIGSWVVGEDACGMGIREDNKLITANMSYFASHFIED